MKMRKMALSFGVARWTCTNIISCTLFSFTSKTLLSKLFLPTPLWLSEIHHYHRWIKNGEGVENDRYSRSKEGERWVEMMWGVRIQRDWEQTMSNDGGVCVCVRGKNREVLEVDPGSRGPAGLTVLPAASVCPTNPQIPFLLSKSSSFLALSFFCISSFPLLFL